MSKCECPSYCPARQHVFMSPCHGECGCEHCGKPVEFHLEEARNSLEDRKNRVRTVFLVILEDRHNDPDISVFTTKEAADRCFEVIKELYPGEQWVSDEPSTEHWLRFEHTDDDGPNLRIEWHEVDGE